MSTVTPPTERRIVELPRGADGLFEQPDWTKMSADERADYARDMQKRRMGAAHDADFADAVTGLANTNDPTSEYVCQGCNRRSGKKCVKVSVKELVLPESSSCNKYEIECVGDPEHDNQALSPDEAGFAIRDVKNGKFGCPNCTLQEQSGFVDELDRTLWCRRWAFTVHLLNCCAKNSAGELKIDADGMPLEEQRDDDTPAAPARRRSISATPVQQTRGRRLYTIDEFAKLTAKQRDIGELAITMNCLEPPEFGESGRVITYTFSTPAVGRDLHTVAADAWQLDNFQTNPVFLWFHDDSQPPIGRVIDIGTVGNKLKGTVEYADRDLSPFADMIYRMVKARYINAVSASWMPIAWNFAKDKARAGGVDFTKVDLLEVSQVPIPALPAALAEARSNGIDTAPMVTWAERLLDRSGMSLVPRDELETLRRAAKMPKAKTTTEPANGGDTSSAVRRALKTKHDRAIARAPAVAVLKRGLYDLPRIVEILQCLDWAHDCSEYEAAIEGDDSPVPAMIGELVIKCGEMLKAMTEEEVDELLASHDEEDEDDSMEMERALSTEERDFIAAGKTPRVRAWRRGFAIARAGKALSKANQETLDAAGAHHERAIKHSGDLGKHHEAVSGHMKEARAAHEEVRGTLEELGIHVRAAQDNPDDAEEHLGKAAKAHKKADGQVTDAEDATADATDRHEDVGDSHRAMTRCVKSAQRSLRTVTDAADTADDPENPDDPDADDDENTKKAEADTARRLRQAKAHQLRGAAA
jgi:hypothetical protein